MNRRELIAASFGGILIAAGAKTVTATPSAPVETRVERVRRLMTWDNYYDPVIGRDFQFRVFAYDGHQNKPMILLTVVEAETGQTHTVNGCEFYTARAFAVDYSTDYLDDMDDGDLTNLIMHRKLDCVREYHSFAHKRQQGVV